MSDQCLAEIQSSNILKWRYLLWIVVVAFGLGCQHHSHSNRGSSPTFRVMTYNIHHGEGQDGKVDLVRIADIIKREQADLVALQEVDRGVARTDRRDLPAELAQLTGLSCVFSNNYHFQGGEYGNAVLTRFPILGATNLHYQMLRTNEQRGLLQATVAVHGRPLVFMNTHIDHRRDDAERLQSVRELRGVAEACGRTPIIVCGDFNDTPASRVHGQLAEVFTDAWETAGEGPGWTYPANHPAKRIDYVWISKSAAIEVVGARVIPSDASDHAALVVELRFR